MLKTTGLKHSYASSVKLEFPDLNFDRGEKGLILGESGCGKTTLLQLLGGLRRVQTGEVEISGERIGAMNTTTLDRFRGRHIGFVFQQAHALPSLDVMQNLGLARKLAGVSAAPEEDLSMLDRLGIADKANSKPGKLSQGERQRLAIARALVNRPSVILADEPTSALDDRNTEAVANLLIEQAQSVAATLLVVTHDARLRGYFSQQITLKKPRG